MLNKIRPLELFLIQIVLYLLLWLFNDYIATLISIVFGGIFLLILIISLLVELVERSKVPRSYYIFMALSVVAPILAALFYILIGGELTWLSQ